MQGDRRHLEMLAVEANYFKARSLQKLATLAIKKHKKVAQIIKISPKWVPKYVKNQGCIADAFLERLWVAPGVPRVEFAGPSWEPFSVKNRQKSKKGRQGSPNGAKNLKKRNLKINVKNCIEK